MAVPMRGFLFFLTRVYLRSNKNCLDGNAKREQLQLNAIEYTYKRLSKDIKNDDSKI